MQRFAYLRALLERDFGRGISVPFGQGSSGCLADYSCYVI
jgi:hypothetical protein